jgi:hypothetical protein
MRVMAAMILVTAMATTPGWAADVPPTATAPAAAATEASTRPKNLEKALQEEVSFDYANAWLGDVIDGIRDATQTNIAVNWPALAQSGIKRDTPVTLKVSKVTYEQAVRALIEQLPTTRSRANYLVGDNALEITTNAELGKHAVVKIFPIGRLVNISADGKAAPEQQAAHGEFLKKIVRMELQRADEDPDREGRALVVKDDLLVATQSRRGLLYVQQTLWRFAAPVRQGEQAPGTVMSVAAKKAEQRMNELVGEKPGALAALARDAAKVAPELNVVLLPGTAKAAELDYLVTEGGVVMIGPAADIRGRGMLVVYDLKDLLKRLAFKSRKPAASQPANAELAEGVMKQLEAKVSPGKYKGAAWGEMGKAPSAMELYENLLVVSGSPAVQRGVAAGLQELYK